jgi:hypothetical protein
MPVVPIRWVLVRDPLGQFDPQALLCTDPTRDPLVSVRRAPPCSELGVLARLMTLKRSLRSGSWDGGRHD